MNNTHKKGVRGSVSKYTDARIRSMLSTSNITSVKDWAEHFAVSETTIRRWRRRFGNDGTADVKTVFKPDPLVDGQYVFGVDLAKGKGIHTETFFMSRDEFERFQGLDAEIEKLHQELRKTLETWNRIISDSERECAALREKLAETEAMRTASVIETAAAISESANWRYNLVAIEKSRDYWCNEARESRLGCEAAETSARESLERLGRVEAKLIWWQRRPSLAFLASIGLVCLGIIMGLGGPHFK